MTSFPPENGTARHRIWQNPTARARVPAYPPNSGSLRASLLSFAARRNHGNTMGKIKADSNRIALPVSLIDSDEADFLCSTVRTVPANRPSLLIRGGPQDRDGSCHTYAPGEACVMSSTAAGCFSTESKRLGAAPASGEGRLPNTGFPSLNSGPLAGFSAGGALLSFTFLF